MPYVSHFNVLGENIDVKDSAAQETISSVQNTINNMQNVSWVENVAALKAYNAKLNEHIFTKNYYDNGGGAHYLIIDETSEEIPDTIYESLFIKLNNGHVAKLIDIPDFDNTGIRGYYGDITDRLIEMLTQNYVIFNSGSFDISKQITVAHDIKILLKGNTRLNAAADMDYLFVFGDYQYSEYDGVYNYGPGINVSSFTNNDINQIIDTSLFHPGRDYFNNGELFIPSYGTSRTGQFKLYGAFVNGGFTSYTNAKVYRYNTCRVQISGAGNLQLSNNSYDIPTLVRFVCCADTNVENLIVKNMNGIAALGMALCINCYFNNIFAYQNEAASQGLDYGVSIDSSQNITFDNVTAYGLRHGFSIGGGGTDHSSVNRYISVKNGFIDSTESYSADLHGNCQFCGYEGTLMQGLDVAGDNCYCHGVIRTKNTSRSIFLTQPVSWNHDFSNIKHFHDSDSVTCIALESPQGRIGGTLDFSDSQIIKGTNSTLTMFFAGYTPSGSGHAVINCRNLVMIYGSLTVLGNLTLTTQPTTGKIDLVDAGGSIGVPSQITNQETTVDNFIGSNYQKVSV